MKHYLIVLLPLLAIEWFVGMLRSSFTFFQTIFKVINFPTIYAYLWLESKPSEWWFEHLGTELITDEIAQWILFVLMVMIQAVLLCLILRLVGVIKKK